MTKSERFDFGAQCRVALALTGTSSTAGAEAALNGAVIDRFTNWDTEYGSAILIVHATETSGIGSPDDLDIAVIVQEGDTSTPDTTFATLATADEILTDGGATPGFKAYKVDLQGIKRYFRVQVTPNFDAADTDVAVLGAFWVFGGPRNFPTTLVA